MPSKRQRKLWFTQDLEQAMLNTLTLGLDRWFMEAAPGDLNKYFWPSQPGGDVTVFSSCSGVPLTKWAHKTCLEMFSQIARTSTPRRANHYFQSLQEGIVHGIREVLTLPLGTQIILTHSVPEAYRLAALLLWIEAGRKPMTAILPGSGEARNPLTAAVQANPAESDRLHPGYQVPEPVDLVQIPLRLSDGQLRSDVQLLELFHREAERAPSQPFVYGTLGDATGVVAPLSCPPPARLILDAAQMRLRPGRVGDHVRRGWPVIISGAGFLGAPGPTGALVLPHGRFADQAVAQAISAGRFDFTDGWDAESGPLPYSGTVLRWLPAVANLRGISALGRTADARIAFMTYQMTNFLAEFPDIEVLPGRTEHHVAICGRESGTVTFAIRDSRKPGGRLSMPDLIAVYHDLSREGILIGHPVMAGDRAALRIAISAEDVQYGDIGPGLARLGDALTRANTFRPMIRRKPGPHSPGGAGRLQRRTAGASHRCAPEPLPC